MVMFATRSLFARLSVLGLALMLALGACDDSQSKVTNDPGPLPNAFGGWGGAVIAQPAAGAGQGSRAGSGGEMTMLAMSCQAVPKGQVAKIDDFEDGDTAAFPEQGREGFWGTVHDDTTGMMLPAGEFMPQDGGVNGSRLAAHVSASGYSDWGALFSTTLSYLSDGVRCAYNASSFAGLRFYVHGSGRLRVSMAIPATQSNEFGGACDANKGMICYDTHSTFVTLSSEWRLYEMPWSQFVQRGFGTAAVFRPDQILVVQFNFDSADLPVELWLDDVSFWDGIPTPVSSGGAGGNGAGGATAGNGAGGATAGNGAGGATAGNGAGGATGGNGGLSSGGAGAGGIPGAGAAP